MTRETYPIRLKSLLQIVIFVACLWRHDSLHAFDWTSNDIQVLHGTTFELGTPNRTTITIEHSDGWKYGSNFFFADIIQRSDMSTEIYTEVYSYLSFNKITEANLTLGPIKDISLFAGLNISNKPEQDNFKAYLFGLSLNLANVWFDYLQLDIAAVKNDNVQDRFGIQVTPVWSIPFTINSLHFKFRGFTDFQTANGNVPGNFQILSQPQLLLDLGNLTGWHKDRLYVGTEYSYWYHKYGLRNVNESVVQALLICFF